jgi:hypothetical protein
VQILGETLSIGTGAEQEALFGAETYLVIYDNTNN